MGEPDHGARQPITTDRGYEQSDVAIRPLMIFLAGLVTMLIVSALVVAALFFLLEYRADKSDPAPLPLAQQDSVTPGPLLQVVPREDLDTFLARQERVLTTPEWIDRDRGIARIPLDDALTLTAERGLPNWPAVEAAPAQPASGAQAPAEGGSQP